ncbi:MAG TPA: LiaF domain-containing protein [Chitinophagaceae bacterium]|nr:LiaF domain-containing protein [Chitinophagaceae bacterium]
MNEFETRREAKRRWREERREARKKWMQERWNNKDFHKMHKKESVWTGIFIFLVGVGALLKATIPEIPNWIFSWPVFLIALGLFIGFRHSFRGVAWFILIVVGGIFLFQHLNPDVRMDRYIWPLALIVVGLFFMIRPWRRNMHSPEKKNGALQGDSGNGPIGINETWNDEDFVDSTSIFGGAKKNIISKKFRGGDLVNIFAGTDLDLTQADFTGTAIIELTTIFGGTKLIIPSNWSIQSDAVIIFGGIEDKRKMPATTENPDKILILKGTVIFGGIEIKSY